MNRIRNRFIACTAAALIACGVMIPSAAFAEVAVDGQPLGQGENAVGGGTATLSETVLDMVNVVAGTLNTDQNLVINFNGGNEIDDVLVSDSAVVEMNFTGENDVDDITVGGKADLTINADGHNDFDEVMAAGDSNLTINVAGENEFEEIEGKDNANITVRGVTCQKRDIIELGDDEDDTLIMTENGNLVLDHVTIDTEARFALIGTIGGEMLIDTSKIAKGDKNETVLIMVERALTIRESVIDIVGTITVEGKMIIDHSDVKVINSDTRDPDSPYPCVFSLTGIELLNEKNGEVKEGKSYQRKAWYVDTGDSPDVDLKADGEPAYYRCKSDESDDAGTKAMPQTGDETNVPMLMVTLISALTVALAARRRFTAASRW